MSLNLTRRAFKSPNNIVWAELKIFDILYNTKIEIDFFLQSKRYFLIQCIGFPDIYNYLTALIIIFRRAFFFSILIAWFLNHRLISTLKQHILYFIILTAKHSFLQRSTNQSLQCIKQWGKKCNVPRWNEMEHRNKIANTLSFSSIPWRRK